MLDLHVAFMLFIEHILLKTSTLYIIVPTFLAIYLLVLYCPDRNAIELVCSLSYTVSNFDMIQCTYLICNRKDEHFVTFYFYNCRVYVDKKVCFNHILSKFYIENILKNPYVKEKFVSDLQSQVSGFLQVPQFPPQIKLGATI